MIDGHDILLLPSWYETFGTIALEAMARERQALVSAGCGISQWAQLAGPLQVIGEGGELVARLQALGSLDADTCRALARDSREKALALNESGAETWVNLFSEHAENRVDN